MDIVSRHLSLDAVHNFHLFFFQKLNKLSKHGFFFFSHLAKLFAFSLHHISKHWLLRIVFLCLDVFFDSVFGPLVKRGNDDGLNLFTRLLFFGLWIRLVFFDKFSFFYLFILLSFLFSCLFAILNDLLIVTLDCGFVDASFESCLFFAAEDYNYFRRAAGFEK